MIIVGKKQDLYNLDKYPKDLIVAIENTINILDENYGIDRDIQKDLGGYVVIVESSNDIEKLKSIIIDNLESEYTDVIECNEGI